MEERRETPWLMSVNIFDPHGPFDAPLSYKNRYDPAKLPEPLFAPSDADVQSRLAGAYFQTAFAVPDATVKDKKASYYGMIELIDEQVGRMLEALERTGQRERTLVIFMSDHGEILGDHGLVAKGCRFYEGLVRVPLILSWPGVFQAGLVSNALVELTDLAPTLAEVAGFELKRTHGRSLVPILTGQSDPHAHRDFVRCEYYDALVPYAPEDLTGHGPTWATMYRDDHYKLVNYHGLDYGELYDMRADPEEFHNLWEEPGAAGVKTELLKRSFDASIVITDPGAPIIGRY